MSDYPQEELSKDLKQKLFDAFRRSIGDRFTPKDQLDQPELPPLSDIAEPLGNEPSGRPATVGVSESERTALGVEVDYSFEETAVALATLPAEGVSNSFERESSLAATRKTSLQWGLDPVSAMEASSHGVLDELFEKPADNMVTGLEISAQRALREEEAAAARLEEAQEAAALSLEALYASSAVPQSGQPDSSAALAKASRALLDRLTLEGVIAPEELAALDEPMLAKPFAEDHRSVSQSSLQPADSRVAASNILQFPLGPRQEEFVSLVASELMAEPLASQQALAVVENQGFNATLSLDDLALDGRATTGQSAGDIGQDFSKIPANKADVPDTLSAPPKTARAQDNGSNSHRYGFQQQASGGSMADLSGYKDLSRAPFAELDEETAPSSNGAATTTTYAEPVKQPISHSSYGEPTSMQHTHHTAAPSLSLENLGIDMKPPVESEFSGNVQTLIRLVSELPEGVTKQTGAQIIRLTMEAMGISMEEVLSEAQSAQSEMLDAVRANIKKIEEFKTVIRKLESDIKYYQGKANELSEIIDLFILSNSTSGKMPNPDDLTH
ncbi:MAG: hypothetical protein SFZ03_11230 [Candidatus Melainabacteria bacterium]|nr:hypothetical protein [Candidatus Melainabacteria bacterium]